MSKNAIYKDDFLLNVTCDSCGRREKFLFKDYKKLKEYGWRVTNFDGKWVDFCSQECYNSYTKNIRKKVGYEKIWNL